MSDWIDSFTPAERAEWDAFVQHVREDALVKINSSAFVLSLVPRGEPDIKYAVELGLAIMLDKPIVLVAMPEAVLSERLRRVADEVIVADLDTEKGRKQVADAMERIAR